ncbi:MAG: glycosyltransferase [Planctomycetes bacterium]|nr:glycosyltransferase [Planctomycetota bacterium]
MNRILYVITELDVGGAEKALVALATRLSRAAYEPQVACLSGRGPLAADLRERGIPVHFLGMRGWWHLPALWRLRRLAKQADIVHSFLYHANMATRLAAVGTRAIVVSSARVAERSRPRRRRLECLTQRLVDAEVCVSEGVRDFFAAGGFPKSKLVVIPNGVDVARFDGRDPAFKARLAIPPHAPLVTTIGRLHEQKGMELFIRAAASVRHSRPDCHFLIVGAGPLEAPLRAAAKSLHLEGALTFLGQCNDVAAVLRATDAFVLASLWEGMPNVVLEAMAAGAPVVATRVEGTVDLIEHGETGLLVMPRDVPGLVSAIRRVLDEPALARRLAGAAQERVRTHFPLDAMVRRHEALYADLLMRSGR